MAEVTYHKSHSFVDLEGKTYTFLTQLYKVGAYGILNGGFSTQVGFTPQGIKKMENLEKSKTKRKDFKL